MRAYTDEVKDLASATEKLIEQLGHRLDPNTIQLLRGQSPQLISLDLSKQDGDESLKPRDIMAFVDFFEFNTSVTSLNLNFNEGIGDNGALHLSLILRKNTILTKLHLQGCVQAEQTYKAHAHPPGAVTIVEALIDNTTLKVLDLSGNNLQLLPSNMQQCFYQALSNDRTLIELDLTNTVCNNSLHVIMKDNGPLKTLRDDIESADSPEIDEEDVARVAQGLEDLVLLCQEELQSRTQAVMVELKNWLEPSTLQLLQEQSPKLTCLDLSRTFSGASLRPDHIKVLVEFLKVNKTVTSLNLNYNYEIGDEGAAYLVELLKNNRTLRELHLSRCVEAKWSNDPFPPLSGAVMIIETLATNNILQVLDLSGNDLEHLPSVMAQRFYVALANNETLIELNLAGNHIANGHYHDLAAVLKNNQTLKTLNLDGNSLGYKMKYIAEPLKEHSSLTTLSLVYNQIADADADSIAEIVKANTGLVVLDLSDNTQDFTNKGLLLIADALKSNDSLTEIKLSNYDGIAVGVGKITRQLEENCWVRNGILSSYRNAYQLLCLVDKCEYDKSAPITLLPHDVLEIIFSQLVLLYRQAMLPRSEELLHFGGTHRHRMFALSWDVQIKDKISSQYKAWWSISVKCVEDKGIQISLMNTELSRPLCEVLQTLSAETRFRKRKDKMDFLISDANCIQSLMMHLNFSEEQYGDFCQRYYIPVLARAEKQLSARPESNCSVM